MKKLLGILVIGLLFCSIGYAKTKIFTHAIKGLHESDFILAAKVDEIT